MKLLFSLLLLLFCFILPAKVFNVNNNPGIEADFDNLQEAINDVAVEPGDTLLVHGSPTSYGSISLIKKVTILGTGYFLTKNSDTQASLLSSIIGTVAIGPPGSGSILSGLTLQNISAVGIEIEDASNLLISRNFIDAQVQRFGNAFGIRISGNSSGILISQNYIFTTNSGGGGLGFCISGAPTISNIVVSNNILSGDACFSLHNASVRNNSAVNGSGGGLVSCFVENNVFNFTDALGTSNCSISYNVITGDYFPSSNGNQVEVSMFDLFIGFPDNPVDYSEDRRFQLKANSPAVGAGLDPLGNPVDCGAFGGPEPYRLSGIPRIPNIYFLGIPGSANFGESLPVRIKVNAN